MFDALSDLSYEQTPQVSYVTFQCRFETRPGYSLYIIGNIREMGSWQPSNSIALTTNSDMYPTWKTSKPIIVPTGSEIDYKYLIKNDSGDYEWEYLPQNENRHLDIKSPGKWTIKDEKDNLFSEVINRDYLSRSQNNLLELIDNNNNNMFSHTVSPYQASPLPWSDAVKYDERNTKTINSEIFDMCLSLKGEAFSPDDRVVIVTALLPFKIVKTKLPDNPSSPNEKYQIVPLTDNITYYTLFKFKQLHIMKVAWIGMLKGIFEFTEEEQEEIIMFLEEQDISLVTTTKKESDDYWTYIDKILSPFFIHNTIDFKNDFFWDCEEYFNTFYTVNRLFRDAIWAIKQENDFIMINDINLALLPNAFLPKNTNAKLGIYFYVTFPSSDAMKIFPYNKELIKSILLCDVIGFHSYISARNFTAFLGREFGLYCDIKPKGYMTLNYIGRYILMHVHHPGIETFVIDELVKEKATVECTEKYKKIIGNRFSVVSIDNTYELSQLFVKFEAFRLLLMKYPALRDKVALIQILLDDQACVHNYKDIIVHKLQQLQREYGNECVHYELHKQSEFKLQYQIGLVSICNVLLILQKWKGLCSLANIFLYLHRNSRSKGKFGLIINENASVSNKLKSAIRINSYNRNELMKRLEEIYTKSHSMVIKYMVHYDKDYFSIKANSTLSWLNGFLSDIKRVSSNDQFYTKIDLGIKFNYRIMQLPVNFSKLTLRKVYKTYAQTFKRYFFFDYENTLFQTDEEEEMLNSEKESRMNLHKPTSEIIYILEKLLADPRNEVYIITGRQKKYLDGWFGNVKGIGLGAEYGFFYRKCRSDSSFNVGPYETMFAIKNWSWKETVENIFKSFTDKTEGSRYCNKESTITWVYGNCSQDFGHTQANELKTHLSNVIPDDTQLDVVMGINYVEVKPRNLNKGYFISHILEQDVKNGVKPEFIFAVGDDISDEEMFKYLNGLEHALGNKRSSCKIMSVTVGKKPSNARYYVNDVKDLTKQLTSLIKNEDVF